MAHNIPEIPAVQTVIEAEWLYRCEGMCACCHKSHNKDPPDWTQTQVGAEKQDNIHHKQAAVPAENGPQANEWMSDEIYQVLHSANMCFFE